MQAACARAVDLNADLGEEVTDDEALLGVVTSANVACGFHAGSARGHARGLRASAPAWVSASVRRSPTRTVRASGAARWTCLRTCSPIRSPSRSALLTEIARGSGTRVAYLKPHGALYNRVVDDDEQAAGGARGVR